MIDELGIVGYINEKLGTDARENVSAGIIVKAMLLNGLGFISAPPLCLKQNRMKGFQNRTPLQSPTDIRETTELWLEMASGNQSDKAKFAELLEAFQEQWNFEGLCVADSAFSQGNLQSMTSLNWLTRIPLTLQEAQQKLEQASNF